jgi:hypothetical protein
VPIVGACGIVVAVMLLVVVAVEDPLALAAVTLNVYDVEEAKPVTVNGATSVAVSDPGVDVAV